VATIRKEGKRDTKKRNKDEVLAREEPFLMETCRGSPSHSGIHRKKY